MKKSHRAIQVTLSDVMQLYKAVYKKSRCLICNAPIKNNFRDYSFAAGDSPKTYYKLIICKGCNTIYTYPFATEKDLKKLYRNYDPHTHDYSIRKNLIIRVHDAIEKYVFKFCINSNNTVFKKIVTRIPLPFSFQTFPLYTCHKNKKLKILDVGCGAGHFLMLAKDNGCDVYGTEIDKQLVNELNKRGIKAFTGLKKISRSNKTFNIIRLNHVLEHLSNPNTILRNLKDLSNKKTEIIVGIPNFDTPAKIFKDKMFMHLPFHRIYLNKSGITTLLENNGFKIKFIRTRSNGVFSRSIFRKFTNLPQFLKILIKIIEVPLLSIPVDVLQSGDSFEVYTRIK